MTPREKAGLDLKVAELSEHQEEEVRSIRFPELLIIVAKRKSFIAAFVGGAALLACIVSFLLPKMYLGNAKIMPPQQNQSMSALGLINQMGPLASLAGQSLGLRSPSDLYVGMLHSQTIADALVQRFSLMQVYGEKFHVEAVKKLESRTEISAGKDGLISISVEDRLPQRAADLANAYVEELSQLTKTLAVTEAGQRRLFFEGEVKTASEDLAAAELALKQTQEKTGLIVIDSQSRAMIEALMSLRARVATQEVVVQSMTSYAAPENPELVRAREELAALQSQLSRLEGGSGKRFFGDVPIEHVPTAGLEYIRKLREVKYREALFELLAKQYEIAKIDEARDALVIQQLDKAAPPERKSWPKRSFIVVAVVILAVFVSVLLALFMENLERGRSDPQFSARMQLFRFYIQRHQRP